MKNNPLWDNDQIQFPRLIAEIQATQDLDFEALAESMDLETSEVHALFVRAEKLWEKLKDIHCTRDLFTKDVFQKKINGSEVELRIGRMFMSFVLLSALLRGDFRPKTRFHIKTIDEALAVMN